MFHHIEFLRLRERRVLVILVAPDGDVQNRVIFTAQDYTQAQLIEASNYLNAHYAGLTHRGGARAPEDRGRRAARRDRRADAGRGAGRQRGHGRQRGAGGRSPASATCSAVQDFSSDMGSLRKLFDVFEQKTQLMRLLEVSSRAEGVRIYIGGESLVVPFEELSVVSAPYEVDGQVVGTLGVIGPTRMAYDRMIQIVDITSRLVANALSQK